MQTDDLPRLTDAEREALDDEYSVTPSLLTDEALGALTPQPRLVCPRWRAIARDCIRRLTALAGAP